MNRDKAREFFSAHAEGNLDEGLRNSLEQRLAQDGELKAEFDSFRSAVRDLDVLKTESIALPHDLHDRISARLDKHLWEQQRRSKPTWQMWLRSLGYAGAAGLIVFGGIIALKNRGGAATAGVIDGSLPVNEIQAVNESGSFKIKFAASSEKTIHISVGGHTTDTVIPKGTSWVSDLKNPRPDAAVFTVRIDGEAQPMQVVLPGTNPQPAMRGEGDLVAFGKALADTYRIAIVMKPRAGADSLSWTLSDTDAVKAASGLLSAQDYSVDLKGDNVLWIVSH